MAGRAGEGGGEASADQRASTRRGLLGGGGGIVEADETYYGNRDVPYFSPSRRGRPYITKSGKGANKRAIVALVERGGPVRTFHVERADKATITNIVRENIAREAQLFTDESKLYSGADAHFASHDTIKHTANEYVRREMRQTDDVTFEQRLIHTNTVENYFSVFKRGMRGIYQHCGEKHLHRYLAEYDFRYNNRSATGVSDTERAEKVAKQAGGKRLMYQRPTL